MLSAPLAAAGGKVICLVRGEDNRAAGERLAAGFDSGDAGLKQRYESLARDFLEVLAASLEEPGLGLLDEDWQRLAREVDLVVHPAAFVNHVLPYSQLFGPNVFGTGELIHLSITDHLKPINYISTLGAALLPDGGVLDEDEDVRYVAPIRHLDADNYAAGYALSKWAGEVLLRDAHERCGVPVSVFRCDMILAHSQYRGQLNVPDVFNRWLYSTVLTGLAPASYYETGSEALPHYDGLPVDFTAQAIAVLGAKTVSGFQTYHVINSHDDGISMDTFVDWAIEAGYPIDRIGGYQDWYERFATALRALPEQQRQQSSLPLIHQLRKPIPCIAGAFAPAQRFEDGVRDCAVGQNGEIPRLSAAFIRKCLNDLHHVGLLDHKSASGNEDRYHA